ncbi:MAG: urea ABC transporter substrate-binding protein [Planctomycetaceae bacterium]
MSDPLPCLPSSSPQPVSRRRALADGTAATLAAARLLAPALFTGCSLGLPPRARAVTVGMLHSQTGPLGISATGLRDIELHAFERINAAGGILGHPIEAHAPDPRSRTDLFVRKARQLLDEGVACIFGCWTSASRQAVLPLIEEARKLLFYSVQYEGNESSKYVVYGGMVPNQQIFPALDWLMTPAGGDRKKIFLVGSDYVFPRTANYVAKKYLQDKALKPVGEAYLPLGDRDFTAPVQRILESGADCVLSTVNGTSNLGLFQALAAAKVDSEKLPVFSTSIAEDELRSLVPDQVRGHYALSCYFQCLDTPANRRWITGFRDEFGFDRVTGDPMEPDWCLVHLWKQAVEKAGSFETEAVRQAFRDGLSFAGPGGPVRLDPKTQHTSKFFRIGRIRPDRQFDIVHASEAPLDPDPYPQIAFPGWSVDWTTEGVTRGPEVDIDGDV